MDIVILPLGAAQEVGRSCFMLNVGDVNIMLDCGVHLGYRDARALPDFSVLGDAARISEEVHAVVITHFHLDHIGALPYLTEVLGYRGPIYMTEATKAVAQLQLEEFCHIFSRRGQALYSLDQVAQSLARVNGMPLDRPLEAGPGGLRLTAHYAGHVMGAAMFHCEVGAARVLYTGDYNMVSDRLVGAAKVPRLWPDVLITESTFATTVREARSVREARFLDDVAATVARGGKVLIPVNALGNAQELAVLLDGFWKRKGLSVPVYMTEGAARKAAALLMTLTEWGSERLRVRSAEAKNEDAHAAPPIPQFRVWRPDLVHAAGPLVLFATPGMLQGGASLHAFKEWAPEAHNLIMLPGYCIAGTVGNMLQQGVKKDGGKVLHLDEQTTVHVRCKVEYLAFSAHADAKGIMDLARHVQPRNVVLVHGEVDKMRFLQERLQASLAVPCYIPTLAVPFTIAPAATLSLRVTRDCMAQALARDAYASSTRVLQAIASRGPEGSKVLKRLRTCMAEAGARGAEEGAGAATPGSPERGADAQQRGSAAQDVQEVAHALARLSQSSGRPETLRVDAAVLGPGASAPERELRLGTDAEAAAAASASCLPDDVDQFLDLATASIDRAGYGSVTVKRHGAMLSVGDVRVRLVPDTEDVDYVRSASPGDAHSVAWIWEVMLSGHGAHAGALGLDVCNVLLQLGA